MRRPLTRQAHAELKHEVMRAVNRLPGVFVFPTGVGSFRSIYKGRTRFIRMGMVGTADLVGWRAQQSATISAIPPKPLPRFVALEIKVGDDTLSPEQAAFLGKVKAAGGIALEVRSVMQAVEALA